jgi:hypothetical protein
LSHYVEGDLRARAQRRLRRHAEHCADCGRGILAMRALVRVIPVIAGADVIRAPAGIFNQVRLAAADGGSGQAIPAPPDA